MDVILTGAASGSASTLTSGGNPDSFREIALSVGVSETALVAQIFDAVSITPSVDGPITSASWSIDARSTSSADSGAVQIAVGISVQQDGVTTTAVEEGSCIIRWATPDCAAGIRRGSDGHRALPRPTSCDKSCVPSLRIALVHDWLTGMREERAS